jgi:hypothetical protein
MDDKERFETLELIEWLKAKTQQAVEEQKPYVQLSLLDCLDLIENLRKKAEVEEEAKNYKKLAIFLGNLINEAFEIYRQPGDQGLKLREVAKVFGLTDGTRKRKSKINPLRVVVDYYDLINGPWNLDNFTRKKPVAKDEALKIIKDKYGFQSEESTKKFIQRATKKKATNEVKEFFQHLFKTNFKTREE